MFSGRKLGALLGAIGAIAFSTAAAATPAALTPQPPAPAAARPEAPLVPRPAIWLLADADTRIYLFGTIHVLPPGLSWRSPAFDDIVAQADELVIEVAEDPAETELAAVASSVMLGKQVPILWRVSPDRREALREMIESVDLSVDVFDGMQTWAAAMTIAVAAIAKAYAGEDGSIEDLTGVEDALRTDFTQAGRPISGVETGTQQLGFLSGLPLGSQREMLESMVDAYLRRRPRHHRAEREWLAQRRCRQHRRRNGRAAARGVRGADHPAQHCLDRLAARSDGAAGHGAVRGRRRPSRRTRFGAVDARRAGRSGNPAGLTSLQAKSAFPVLLSAILDTSSRLD